VSREAEVDIMTRLIECSKNAHDLTTNQGIKPALVYIINRESLVNFVEWPDPRTATAKIMRKLKKSDRFEKEQRAWKDRGKTIKSADELLRCYYASISVVFIPEFYPEHPGCEASLMHRQYKLLYEEICKLSTLSSERREKAGVLFDF